MRARVTNACQHRENLMTVERLPVKNNSGRRVVGHKIDQRQDGEANNFPLIIYLFSRVRCYHLHTKFRYISLLYSSFVRVCNAFAPDSASGRCSHRTTNLTALQMPAYLSLDRRYVSMSSSRGYVGNNGVRK